MILVTGGAGYIGSILVPALLIEGHRVTVIDNFMYGQTALLDCCNNKGLDVERGEVKDKELMQRHLREAEVIIPLACLTGAPACDKDPLAAVAINFEAIETMLGLRGRDQRIIFPTTNSGYGIGQERIECTEETPLNPVSLYGRVKVDAEKVILNAGNCITLRLATVFGASPRMRLDLLVNDFVYRAITDRFVGLFEPHFKRNYIHIQDVVRAFVHCMKNFEQMKNQAYNVGLSDANLSKLELCEEIKKQLPDFHFCCSEIGKDPDKRNYIVSNAKIEATGFRPVSTLQNGIAELIKAFQIIRRNQFSNI